MVLSHLYFEYGILGYYSEQLTLYRCSTCNNATKAQFLTY